MNFEIGSRKMIMSHMLSRLDLIVPVVTVVISLVTAHMNNSHRIVDLALKYRSFLENAKRGALSKPFEKAVLCEIELASNFYIWKSLSSLTDHKRTYINYVTFLIYVFGWIGMGFARATKASFENELILLDALLIGSIAMISAFFLIARARYEATLYRGYLFLVDNDKYLPSFHAVVTARNKVVAESIIPIIISFAIALIATYSLGYKTIFPIWIGVVSLLTMANNIEIIRASSNGDNE